MITENIIGGVNSGKGTETLQAISPVTRTSLPGVFQKATLSEINLAVEAAHEAWKTFKKVSGKEKASFLRDIVSEIKALGNILVERAMKESGLPEGRIVGEIGRTCNQLIAFSDLVEEGSWVNAVIDQTIPERKPLPRIDIRKMATALGPVVVFTASNFPLAFSTAGGDTASAFAAGCPVIVKGHPSHLGTNALVAEAIVNAVRKNNLPEGIFSSLQGGIETGVQLVNHPLVKAVGFTGSYAGGKALFDIANLRPEPIPVYAEMGSNNPIFLFPEKLKTETQSIANSISNSVNLGAGQFCTNPGIIVVEKGKAYDAFVEVLKVEFEGLKPGTMLNEGIFKGYENEKNTCVHLPGTEMLFEGAPANGEWNGSPSFASVSAQHFLDNKDYQKEVFGPFTLLVICDDEMEFLRVGKMLNGQLTATLMATPDELEKASELVEILSQKAGRVIFNGVPTGVEVCHAMHHGGPFPTTTNSLCTSVGTDAIRRFGRPVSFQNMPDKLLPRELKRGNPLGIWRKVNGKMTKG